ncbi:DUF4399 domain-containing protein [Motilimonas pumila]|uniref:DUF4399 domain-containing protein n=1 Tax=Motilimonas pumila TaxID=2303987 RepID=A0A418YB41_9GAMM|nr:DUF4399 domain-containing protein [Motilimonas pumila]RJG40185.1 DUF4399 domain-containing protein [Motilimonas pumila]
MKSVWSALLVLLLTVSPWAQADGHVSSAPDNAKVYIISPADGDTVTGPVTVVFGLENMGVAPAGVNKENTGHHHLLIDVETLPDLSLPLPATEQVKHFGAGQTQTQITLKPGKHTLQLLLGNYAHVPHQQPVMSEKITIMVE